jgi:hypothetical protein
MALPLTGGNIGTSFFGKTEERIEVTGSGGRRLK